MKIKVILISLILLASQSAYAENQWSIGGGFQNAGLIGVQWGLV
ncbi:MAG: hypothetical protein ACI9O6_000114 [Glaciecola sp.]|jgi:hypothetical protein